MKPFTPVSSPNREPERDWVLAAQSKLRPEPFGKLRINSAAVLPRSRKGTS